MREQFGIPVLAVISLTDLMQHMSAQGRFAELAAHAELPGPLWAHSLRNTPWKTLDAGLKMTRPQRGVP